MQGPATTDVVRALSERTFLTFAGDETYLLYIQGFPLREFCAFEVFDDAQAWRRMQDELLRPIADAAAANGMGLLAGCLVWRASADYLARLGGRDNAVTTHDATYYFQRLPKEHLKTAMAMEADRMRNRSRAVCCRDDLRSGHPRVVPSCRRARLRHECGKDRDGRRQAGRLDEPAHLDLA